MVVPKVVRYFVGNYTALLVQFKKLENGILAPVDYPEEKSAKVGRVIHTPEFITLFVDIIDITVNIFRRK